MKSTDIFGIGSPLMDLLVNVDDKFLEKLKLTKGSMHLVDLKKSKEIFDSLDKDKIKVSYGDSTANTIAGISNLGLNTTYLGKAGDDNYAKMYNEDIIKRGVTSKIAKNKDIPTGTVIAFITPDSERTFVVHLGAAITLTPDDLNKEDVKNAKIFHTTGYQLEDPNLLSTVLEAVKIAKENNTLISIDVADPDLIKRNLKFLKTFIKENADILFLNESEAKEFTGIDDEEESIQVLQDYAGIICLKIGKKGSLIAKDGMIHYIEADVVDAVDTTGAGDMYAACILYGIARDIDLEIAGKLASFASAKVVSQIGARLDSRLLDEDKVKEILNL